MRRDLPLATPRQGGRGPAIATFASACLQGRTTKDSLSPQYLVGQLCKNPESYENQK